MIVPAFARYIGIDYSGARTPTASLPGLRVYVAKGDAPPVEVAPPPSPRKYWSRRGVAEWLVERLGEQVPTLVGIDHGFSLPQSYFQSYRLEHWSSFLEDFVKHWPTADNTTWVRNVLSGEVGKADQRVGDPSSFRATERRTKSAKSVFNFRQKQGCVAFSTHAGIPWLLFIRQSLDTSVHFWPFDGWEIPAGRSAIAEVYPSLWRGDFAREDRTADQHDAFCVAAWLTRADRDGTLNGVLKPDLLPGDRAAAHLEGWILGVAGRG